METERRQLRKSGDRLAGRGSWDAGAFGLVLSAYACTQNLHVACEKKRNHNSKIGEETKLVGGWGAGERDEEQR